MDDVFGSPATVLPSVPAITGSSSSPKEAVQQAAEVEPQRCLPSSPSGKPNATALSRSGTLSWQQRPSSKGFTTSQSRPLPRDLAQADPVPLNTVNATQLPSPISATATSADQATSFDRQDYQRNSPPRLRSAGRDRPEVERQSRPLPQPPWKTSPSKEEPSSSPTAAAGLQYSNLARSESSPSREGQTPLEVSSRFPTTDVGSPFPMHDSQRFAKPTEDSIHEKGDLQRRRTLIERSGSLRDRSTSPTKGLGGFVQSAMMKRSDSVNKRWSAQATPGISRANSRVGLHSVNEPATPAMPLPESPPRDSSRSPRGYGSSPLSSSRPSSSHGTSSISRPANREESSTRGSRPLPPMHDSSIAADESSTKLLNSSQRAHPHGNELPYRGATSHEPESHSVSPTKTMDSRRWSPTKASWLENALSRPEASKIASPKPQPPHWMVDMQKQKSPVGGSNPSQIPTDSSLASNLATSANPTRFDHFRQQSAIELQPEAKASSPERSCSPVKLGTSETVPVATDLTPSGMQAYPQKSEPEPFVAHRKSPAPEGGPTNSATDFISPTASPNSKKIVSSPNSESLSSSQTSPRVNLRSPQGQSREQSAAEMEFKNVFARLRPTETKNYVAPDELKDNILRGKAALNLTGGPQKTQRVDEFKESILKQKEAMRTSAATSPGNTAEGNRSHKISHDSSSLPEALVRRNTMIKPKTSTREMHGAEPSSRANAMPPAQASEKLSQMTAVARQDIGLKDDALQSADAKETCRDGYVGTRPEAHGEASVLPSTEEKGSLTKGQSKLASRINPQLLDVVRRGSPLTGGKSNASNADFGPIHENSVKRDSGAAHIDTAAKLSHKTKERAKGPKRRLPNSSGDHPNDSTSKQKTGSI